MFSRAMKREVEPVTEVLYFLIREMVHHLKDGLLVSGRLPSRLLLAHASCKSVEHVDVRAQAFDDVVYSHRPSFLGGESSRPVLLSARRPILPRIHRRAV